MPLTKQETDKYSRRKRRKSVNYLPELKLLCPFSSQEHTTSHKAAEQAAFREHMKGLHAVKSRAENYNLVFRISQTT